MNRAVLSILVLVLTSAVMPAFSADITHDFTSGTGRTFGPNNKSCTITQSSGTFTYTCGDDAVFGMSPASQITAMLTHSDDYITLSPVMEDLSEFVVSFTSNISKPTNYTNIKIYISEDGTWGSALPASRVDYTKSGVVKAIIPKGTWYIKVQNTNGSKPVYITRLIYTPVDCNCNTYIRE